MTQNQIIKYYVDKYQNTPLKPEKLERILRECMMFTKSQLSYNINKAFTDTDVPNNNWSMNSVIEACKEI